MQHITVYGEEGIYAGWPANHGAWQWGDEFLVGFIRGKHNVGGMHNVGGSLEKMLARSLDGGETWAIETPNVDFEGELTELAPAFDLANSIIRVCGGYDHGGESCAKDGGFYISNDRGKTWRGAFSFDGLELTEKLKNTSRTCVLEDFVFLSIARRHHWGSDFTICCTHDGKKFVGKSIVCNDDYRAVMPSAASIGERVVVTLRRRGAPRVGGWIDAVHSDDDGASWSDPVHVAETGKDNGNPSALIEANGKLYCAYANRTEATVNVMVSENGERWLPHLMLRKGVAPDIGYPRLFKRTDGQTCLRLLLD
jgi:hypothetical protein